MFPKNKSFLYAAFIALLISSGAFASSNTNCYKSPGLGCCEQYCDDACGCYCSPCDGNSGCMYDDYLKKEESNIEVSLDKSGTLNVFESCSTEFSLSDVKAYKLSEDDQFLMVKYQSSPTIDIFDLQKKLKFLSFNQIEHLRFVNDGTKKDVVVVVNCGGDSSFDAYSKEDFEDIQHELCCCSYIDITLEKGTLKIRSVDQAGPLLYWPNVSAFSFFKDPEEGLMVEFEDGSFTLICSGMVGQEIFSFIAK